MTSIFLTQYNGIIVGPIAKLLGYILSGIYYLLDQINITNSGLCIIIFTFIVNALMIPLTLKQQKFSKMTSVMQPELTAIQKKYKGKKDDESLRRMNMEQQAVYQKYGTSPMGGCLPLLITFPIILALWKVIQNIPAYVPIIRNTYEQAASAIASVPNYADELIKFISGQEGAYESAVTVATKGWGDVKTALGITSDAGIHNHIIDVLAQFRTGTWNDFINTFKGIADSSVIETIEQAQVEIVKANSFVKGINIGDNPSFSNITVIIPILSVLTQMLNTRLMMAKNASSAIDDSPQANTMKTMNTFMPLISGFMCLILPIGVGIYWIAGNVFRIIQQIFVNIYMDKVDVEELRQKNLEKMERKNAKREKMGLPPISVQDVANTKTNSIQNVAKTSIKTPEPKKNYEPKDYSKQEFKEDSISSIANMLSNKNKKQ